MSSSRDCLSEQKSVTVETAPEKADSKSTGTAVSEAQVLVSDKELQEGRENGSSLTTSSQDLPEEQVNGSLLQSTRVDRDMSQAMQNKTPRKEAVPGSDSSLPVLPGLQAVQALPSAGKVVSVCFLVVALLLLVYFAFA